MVRSSFVFPFLLVVSGAGVACTTETVRIVPGDVGAEVAPTDPVLAEEPTPGDEPRLPDAGSSSGGSSSGGSSSGGSSSGGSSSGGSSSGGSSSGGSSSGGSSSGGSSSGGTPAFTGIGATIAECQGKGAVSVPGVTMQSGFAGRMGGALNVFLYSRPQLSSLAYGGTAGEYKLRLLIGGPTGTPNQYQGQAGVFAWSTANAKWESAVGGLSDIVLVDIVDYAVADPTGLMCNGRLRGTAQWLSGSTAYTIAFEVPILTPSFPGANAGPP